MGSCSSTPETMPQQRHVVRQQQQGTVRRDPPKPQHQVTVRRDGPPSVAQASAPVLSARVGGHRIDATRCKQTLVVALDISGSMSGGRLDAVKRGFAGLVDGLFETDNIMVFAFNDDVHMLTNGFEQLTMANKRQLLRKVNGLRATGRTELYQVTEASTAAIRQLALQVHVVAAAAQESVGRFNVVVLTDGSDTSDNSPQKLLRACALLQETNRDLGPGGAIAQALGAGGSGLLRLVFIGVALDDEARQAMSCLVLAAGESATYHDVQNSSGIASVFQEITVRISQDREDLLRQLAGMLVAGAVAAAGGGGTADDDDDHASNWPGLIQKGSHVRCVGTSRGAGGVSIGDVGVVKARDSDGDYIVNFPVKDNWCGRPSDLKLDENADAIRPGALVAIKSGIAPKFGWGPAEAGMRGLVHSVTYDGRAKVQLGFSPAGAAGDGLWTAQLSELDAIQPDEGRRAARPRQLPGRFQIGDAVRVKMSLDQPSTGWGSVKRGSVGFLRAYDPQARIYVVDFADMDGFKCRDADLEIETVANRVRPGQHVKVRPGIGEPSFGWGVANPSSVGVVRKIDYDANPVIVQFGTTFWKGKLSELQVAGVTRAPARREPKLGSPGNLVWNPSTGTFDEVG